MLEINDKELENVNGGVIESVDNQINRELDVSPTESPTGATSDHNALPPDVRPKSHL